jgi:hypothetical protein
VKASWLAAALVVGTSLGGGLASAATPEPRVTAGEPVASPEAAEPAVNVTLTIILARKGPGAPEVAPELAPLAPTLKRAFPDHVRFSRLGRHVLQVSSRSTAPVTLPNGSSLALRHEGTRDGRHALQVEVGGLRTTVQAAPGATFFQAGRAHDGGILVLAFEVAR